MKNIPSKSSLISIDEARNTNVKQKGVIFLDSQRAKEIMNSGETIQVLYQGSPVWLDNVKENNMAEVVRLDRKDKIEVPVYLLIENRPVSRGTVL